MLRRLACALAASALAASAHALDLAGTKTLRLHAKDGSTVEIGKVDFTAARADGRSGFAVKIDTSRFSDHFLSMREFKCLPGHGEILCFVPYPYANPSYVAAGDLAWLEHALLFMFKKPAEFGANLRNGIYWRLEAGERGLVGSAQAIDLNEIGAPPARPNVPPYGPARREDVPAGARWFVRLTIE